MRQWVAIVLGGVGCIIVHGAAAEPTSAPARVPLRHAKLPTSCAAAVVSEPNGESSVLEIDLSSGITVRYEATLAWKEDQPTWESVVVFDGARSYTDFAPRDAATGQLLATLFGDRVRDDFRAAEYLGEAIELVVADQCYFRTSVRVALGLPLMVWGHSAFYRGPELSYEVLDGFKATPRTLRVYHDRSAAQIALDFFRENVDIARRDGRFDRARAALRDMVVEDCTSIARVYEVLDGFVGVGWESWCLGDLRGRASRQPPRVLASFIGASPRGVALERALNALVRPVTARELSQRALRCEP